MTSVTHHPAKTGIRIKWLLIVSIITLSPNSLAWSPSGHRIVCHIAWQSLPASVRENVNSAANNLGYRTFTQGCVWADHIRSNPRFDSLKALHYVNVPKRANSVNRHRDCASNKKPSCVLAAISYYQQRWRNPALNQEQRDQALLLFSHFVGDIHQPMHVSYRFDRGGNRRTVRWINNETLSLHKLWDHAIIHCMNTSSWRKLADQLHLAITPEQRQEWQAMAHNQERTIDQWANESLALTRTLYAALDRPWEPSNYCQQFQPMAWQRLQMAGVRLASLLYD